MTTFGANPLFESERFELIDLIQLLDPKISLCHHCNSQ
jgi:hypothetical protein